MSSWKSSVHHYSEREGTPVSALRNVHKGQTLVVVAPGPSLDLVNVSDLMRFKTIAVNSAIEVIDSDYWVFNDHQFVRAYHARYTDPGFSTSIVTHRQRLKSMIVLVPPRVQTYWYQPQTEHSIHRLQRSRDHTPWWSSVDNLIPGHCTAASSALSLAVYMGASTVCLVGVDFAFDGMRLYALGIRGATRKPYDYHRLALQSGKEWMDGAIRKKVWDCARVVTTSPFLELHGVERVELDSLA